MREEFLRKSIWGKNSAWEKDYLEKKSALEKEYLKNRVRGGKSAWEKQYLGSRVFLDAADLPTHGKPLGVLQKLTQRFQAHVSCIGVCAFVFRYTHDAKCVHVQKECVCSCFGSQISVSCLCCCRDEIIGNQKKSQEYEHARTHARACVIYTSGQGQNRRIHT